MDSPALMTRIMFTTMVEEAGHNLLAYLHRLVGDYEDAKDVLQDTFLAAWQAVQKGNPPFIKTRSDEERRRWLYSVASHKGISLLRRRRLIHWVSLGLIPLKSFDENLIAERDALFGAFVHLEPKERSDVLLYIVQRLKITEIAHMDDIPYHQARNRIQKAVKRLSAIYFQLNPVVEEYPR